MPQRPFILIIVTVLLTFVSSMSAYGQSADKEGMVYFRLVDTQIDTEYLSNRQNLKLIEKLFAGRSGRIESVTISAWSSPEGSPYLNASLAEKRAASFEKLIMETSQGVLDQSKIRSVHVAENWGGLLMMVRERYFRHDREKVIRILTDRSIGDETRKWRLKQLDGGYTWSFLYRRYMPLLRQAVIVDIAYAPADVVPVVASISGAQARAMGLAEYGLIPLVREEIGFGHGRDRGFVLALKTNLLYDALLVPNIGVEVSIGKGWTATAGWNCAWWDRDAAHRYWRIYGGEAEVRKYFGSKARETVLSGHHLGLYGQGYKYDFELGGRGQLSELTYGGGLSYGYALPLGHSFNLDFCVGFGYLGGEYKIYDPDAGCYVWKETRQRHWFGPTKAEVTLAWVIGRKESKSGKGGRR